MSAGVVPTRLLVACSMKSGSTYVSNVLARYFGVDRIEPVEYWGRLEQNLADQFLQPHLDRGFVVQMHLRPHAPNVERLRKYGFRVVHLWRNLGDVLVSFDDHIRGEDHRNPICYIHDRGRYVAMPAQQRYRYLIQNAIPWYLAFHLSWREVPSMLPVVYCRYEDLAADADSFFQEIIRKLGHEADTARLSAILSSPISNTRFNRGISGRGREQLSDEIQGLLDELLLGHAEDLSELWAELPWRGKSRPVKGSLLPYLSACDYNRAAGELFENAEGLCIAIRGEGFFFTVPGELLASGNGRPGKLWVVARGHAGSRFSLYWRGADQEFSQDRAQHVQYEPSSAASKIEFALDAACGRLPLTFRLHCFNAIGANPATGEILECVRAPLNDGHAPQTVRNRWSQVAEQIVTTLNPKTVLDAGPATAPLVPALHERGVQVSSISDRVVAPEVERADLVTWIGVRQDMPESESRAIIGTFGAAEAVLFSPAWPGDAQAMLQWLQLFGEFGFQLDTQYDARVFGTGSMLLRRQAGPPALDLLAAHQQAAATLDSRLVALEQQTNSLRRQVNELLNSRTWRVLRAIGGALLKLRPGTR